MKVAYAPSWGEIVGEVWDSRVEGEDAGTPVSTNEVNALELVQAYVTLDRKVAGAPVSAQIGRFMLNVGSRRLIAADEFRNTTNGYTGFKLDVGEAESLNATFVLVSPQTRRPSDPADLRRAGLAYDRESDDQLLYGAFLSMPFGIERALLQPSYVGFDERDGELVTRDRRLDTFGLRYVREPKRGAWDFDLEGMAQTGAISAGAAPTAAKLDVDARFLHLELGRTFDTPWRPRLGLEYDYVSGDDGGGDFGRFDTLFGFRRAEIAPSGLYNAVGRANLISPGVRFEVAPSTRLDAFATWKRLRLASRVDAFSTSGVRDPTGRAGSNAGDQWDVRVRYWLVPDKLRLDWNAIYLDKRRFLREAPNANEPGDAFYQALDLTVQF